MISKVKDVKKMKNTLIIIFSLLIIITAFVYLTNQPPFFNKKEASNQEAQEVSIAWCDNSDEAEDFENPIPVVWTVKMDGCLASCQGASFTKIPKDEKYPRFSGYYPDTKGGYNIEDWNPIPEEFQEKGLILKITGEWVGIQDDHPQTVFEGKCVPIVNIKKIEIVK